LRNGSAAEDEVLVLEQSFNAVVMGYKEVFVDGEFSDIQRLRLGGRYVVH
jgi:hypothetical protein